MTKNERLNIILKELRDKEASISVEFWKSHGGRPKGYSVMPQEIFKDARAEFKRKWKEIEDKYPSDSD